MTRTLRYLVLVMAGLITLAAPVAAQYSRSGQDRPDRRSPAVSVLAGPSSYDLSGTGTAFAAAIRFDLPVGRVFIVEPGFGFFRYRTQFAQTISYLLPEISLQFQPTRGAVRPYAGVGAGFSEYLTGPGASPGTLHAAAGVRAWVTRDYGLRGEVRLRGLDPFHGGNMTDFVVGVTKRLGR